MNILIVLFILNAICIILLSSKLTKLYIFSVFKDLHVYHGLLRKRTGLMFFLFLSSIALITIGYFYTISYVLLSFWYFKTPLKQQLKIAIRHPLMNPEIRGLAYHVPIIVNKVKKKTELLRNYSKINWISLKHNNQ